MTSDKYTIGLAQPTPPTILIQNPFTSRHLLSIHPDGTVTGEIEDASEAARVFVEHIRGMVAQPTQSDTLRAALEGWRTIYQLAPPHPDIAPDIWQDMIDRTAAALEQSK
jgi:hypothetical protein